MSRTRAIKCDLVAVALRSIACVRSTRIGVDLRRVFSSGDDLTAESKCRT